MSLEAVVGVSSAETIVEALLVGYTQLQTERNLRVREWPLIFASDLEFLRLVEPEWIDRARSWDFLFFWFSRMFYRHANRYQEKLHVISANIHAIWNLRQAMNLDALLNRRPQRRPDFAQGNLPDVPSASSRRQHRRTRSSSSSRSRSYAAGWPSPDADVRHRQRESRPDQRGAAAAGGRSAAGPAAGPFAAPRAAAGGGEINLPRGAHFLSAVREPAFSRTFPRYCAACRCRPAAPQLGRRLDYVDDPTFNAAWHEGPQPSMDELILIARSLCYVFIRLGYEGLQRGTGREIRLFCRQPFIRRLRAAHDHYVWLVDRAAVESRTCNEDDLELLMGYLRLIVETKRASGLNEALLE
jgi:hypothetical protein